MLAGGCCRAATQVSCSASSESCSCLSSARDSPRRFTTFCIVHLPIPGSHIKPPFVVATILLDGADIGFGHLLHEVSLDKVRAGMRVKAMWRPREEWDYAFTNIKYFVPLDEPDVDVDALEKKSFSA